MSFSRIRKPRVILLVSLLLFILPSFGFCTLHYEGPLERRQRALEAVDLPCGSEVTVKEGERYMFDSRSAVIYESSLYAAQYPENSYQESNRRKRAGSAFKLKQQKSHLSSGSSSNQQSNVEPQTSIKVKIIRTENKNQQEQKVQSGKSDQKLSKSELKHQQQHSRSELNTQVSSERKEKKIEEELQGRSYGAGHNGGYLTGGSGYGHGGGFGNGYMAGGNNHRQGGYSGSFGGHSYAGGANYEHGYAGSGGNYAHGSGGENYAHGSGGENYGHSFGGENYAHGFGGGNYPGGHDGSSYASGGGGGYTYNHQGYFQPLVCEWTYFADTNCSLESHIIYFKPGSMDCNKQQLVISDNYTDFRMCGYQTLYPSFRSESEILHIKYWRTPYTYRHVFKGYVTCAGRAQRPVYSEGYENQYYSHEVPTGGTYYNASFTGYNATYNGTTDNGASTSGHHHVQGMLMTKEEIEKIGLHVKPAHEKQHVEVEIEEQQPEEDIQVTVEATKKKTKHQKKDKVKSQKKVETEQEEVEVKIAHHQEQVKKTHESNVEEVLQEMSHLAVAQLAGELDIEKHEQQQAQIIQEHEHEREKELKRQEHEHEQEVKLKQAQERQQHEREQQVKHQQEHERQQHEHEQEVKREHQHEQQTHQHEKIEVTSEIKEDHQTSEKHHEKHQKVGKAEQKEEIVIAVDTTHIKETPQHEKQSQNEITSGETKTLTNPYVSNYTAPNSSMHYPSSGIGQTYSYTSTQTNSQYNPEQYYNNTAITEYLTTPIPHTEYSYIPHTGNSSELEYLDTKIYKGTLPQSAPYTAPYIANISQSDYPTTPYPSVYSQPEYQTTAHPSNYSQFNYPSTPYPSDNSQPDYPTTPYPSANFQPGYPTTPYPIDNTPIEYQTTAYPSNYSQTDYPKTPYPPDDSQPDYSVTSYSGNASQSYNPTTPYMLNTPEYEYSTSYTGSIPQLKYPSSTQPLKEYPPIAYPNANGPVSQSNEALNTRTIYAPEYSSPYPNTVLPAYPNTYPAYSPPQSASYTDAFPPDTTTEYSKPYSVPSTTPLAYPAQYPISPYLSSYPSSAPSSLANYYSSAYPMYGARNHLSSETKNEQNLPTGRSHEEEGGGGSAANDHVLFHPPAYSSGLRPMTMRTSSEAVYPTSLNPQSYPIPASPATAPVVFAYPYNQPITPILFGGATQQRSSGYQYLSPSPTNSNAKMMVVCQYPPPYPCTPLTSAVVQPYPMPLMYGR